METKLQRIVILGGSPAAYEAACTARKILPEAENIKGIKAVDITAPAVNVIRITGSNEQGKTSVLDAIIIAIEPTSSLPPSR